MISKFKIPLEQRTRDEAAGMRIIWKTGAFNFLLSRTQEKYKLKAVGDRRRQLESQLNLKFPEIDDDMLKELYKFACLKYMKRCQQDYGYNSGFGKTPSETAFSKTIATIVKNHPKLKHLEIYPSQEYSKDLPLDFKMVVGNYVPDFIIFGLKHKKSSAVAIEIDGDSHIDKWEKDETRSSHLKQMKLFVFEVQNNQATDLKFLTQALLSLYRLRNGSFNKQIQRTKRGIWVKTISCQMGLSEIEEFVQKTFSIKLNLCKEAQAIVNLDKCPRIIRSELLNYGIKPNSLKFKISELNN